MQTYYRVKANYSDMQCDARFKKVRLVAHELYTATELKRLTEWQRGEYFTPVQISRKDTYFFFGCRFQKNTGWGKGEPITAK